MLKHRFSQKFQITAQKKFFELKKKTHSLELKRRITSAKPKTTDKNDFDDRRY
jgi:hypothetical protein